MYLTSHDEDFRQKRDDVLRVYYDAPADEHIICLDEKTGMQALQRRFPDLPMAPGQPVRREFEYIRHGTLCLMGAYHVRHRKLFGFTAETRGGDAFVDLLDHVDASYPLGRGHLVCDNLFDHDTDDVLDWLEQHPRWTLHFTPKHASWLNQIECAFSILHAKVLARGSFASLDQLRSAVYDFLIWFNSQDKPPFNWTYRPKSWSLPRLNRGRHLCRTALVDQARSSSKSSRVSPAVAPPPSPKSASASSRFCAWSSATFSSTVPRARSL